MRLSHQDQHKELEQRRDKYVSSLHHARLGLFRDADFDARLFTAKSLGVIDDNDIFELLYTHTMLTSYFYSPQGGGSAACCEATGYFKDRYTEYQFDDAPDTHSFHYDVVCPKALTLVFDWKNGKLYSLVRSLLKKRVLDYFIKLARDGEKNRWFDILSTDRLYENKSERDFPSAFNPDKIEEELEEVEYDGTEDYVG